MASAASDAVSSNSEEKKKAARNDVIKQVNALLKQCRDYAPFTRLEAELAEYDRIINKSHAELVYTDENAYIKFSDEEDEKTSLAEESSNDSVT